MAKGRLVFNDVKAYAVVGLPIDMGAMARDLMSVRPALGTAASPLVKCNVKAAPAMNDAAIAIPRINIAPKTPFKSRDFADLAAI